MVKIQGPLRVELTDLKSPISTTSTAQEINVEGVEDCRFLIMELIAIVFDDLDFVTSVTLISIGMEESGVFVSFNSCPDFTSLSLQKQFGMGNSA